jgi:hypothetical protein
MNNMFGLVAFTLPEGFAIVDLAALMAEAKPQRDGLEQFTQLRPVSCQGAHLLEFSMYAHRPCTILLPSPCCHVQLWYHVGSWSRRNRPLVRRPKSDA